MAAPSPRPACRPSLLLLVCGLGACGGSDLLLPSTGEPLDIHVVAGDGQQGIAGELLASPIVIEVTDAAGKPVRGAAVEFTLTSAGEGGEVAPSPVATGADGRAEARVLLGSKTGLQTGEARLVVDRPDAPRASFTALAELPASPPNNESPVADFGSSCTDLTCDFTDRSSDPDGTLAGWSWQFGDGTGSEVREPRHSYAAAGTYTVTLLVTDDDGATDLVSSQVTVSAPAPANEPPRAEFAIECLDFACSFSDQSSDDDGTIVSWAWEFGDGTTSTAASPSHTYAAAGQYRVRLTVRDDDGAEDSRTRDADVSAPPPPNNKLPRADFDVRCDKLECRFTDKSKDDDGSVAAWVWDFGDGGTTSERNPVYTYSTPGKYDVVLTVTDDLGATAAKTKRVDAKR